MAKKKGKVASKKSRWILMLLVLIIIAAGGYYFLQKQPSRLVKAMSLPKTLVNVTKVTSQNIPIRLQATGSLQAGDSVAISPQVSGQIAYIGFKDGQRVKKGDVLFRLDDSVALAQLKAVKAKAALSAANYQRDVQLSRQHAISTQLLDTARQTMLEDKANVRQQKLLAKQMTLKAPFSGVVDQHLFSVGQYVTAGETLVNLVDKQHLKVIYAVSEADLPRLKLGQPITITSSALHNQRFPGRVNYIDPSVDVATRTVTISANIDNEKQQLSPGMYVNVEQQLTVHQNALVIPAQAIVANVAGSNVYKVVNGKASETAITVGQRWKNHVEVLSGVKLGDTIIIAGQQKIRDGAPVRINAKGK